MPAAPRRRKPTPSPLDAYTEPAPSAAPRRVLFECPCCQSPMQKRTSYRLHSFLRAEVYTCTNPLCNASFAAHNELTHIASPSGLSDASRCPLPKLSPRLCKQALAEWKKQQRGN